MNASGSIKARMVKYMIDRAEDTGLISPGDTLVEATSGNTGNALAMVGAVKGYNVVIVMPEGFTHERLSISKAYGAEIRSVGDFFVGEAVEEAKRLGKQPGWWCPGQFDNEWNIEENEMWMGREIVSQIPKGGKVDALVHGVGTGGTLVGVGRALRKNHNPDLKVIALEPEECPTITNGTIEKHHIEGISDGFIPDIFVRNRDAIDEVMTVTSADAIECTRRLAKDYGMLVGSSSGANFIVAHRIKQQYPELKTVLTFFCDEGEKYLSQFYG
jgi:cysteine synthase A